MNAASPLFYTNEASAEFLGTLYQSPYTEQQLAGFNEETLAVVHENEAYAKAHPPIAIHRVATAGSQTRNGGEIQEATSPLALTLENGQCVRAALKGDYVVYDDGRTAQIVTGAGENNGHIALVGSRLSNGDEIINTPLNSYFFLTLEGVPSAEDFLPAIEDCPLSVMLEEKE